MTTTDRIGITM